jgi:hypothetical protein
LRQVLCTNFKAMFRISFSSDEIAAQMNWKLLRGCVRNT